MEETQKEVLLEVAAEEAAVPIPPQTPKDAKKSQSTDVAEVEEEEEKDISGGLGPMFTLSIIIMAALGIGTGIALSDGKGDPELISWVKLPGDLFLRGLTCIVLPLIFVNIFLAFVQMIQAGKASAAGVKILALYTFTTVLAALEGLSVAVFFKQYFTARELDPVNSIPEILLICPNTDDVELFLTFNESAFVCAESSDNSVFEVIDINGVFNIDDGSTVDDSISFSTTLQDGIFKKMVPANIIVDFYNNNFLGVIVFAIILGIASQNVDGDVSEFLRVFEQANLMFLKMVDWLIKTTPIGVFSLIAGNMGQQSNLSEDFANIGWLMASAFTAFSIHFFIVFPTMLLLATKKNPWNYMKYLIPAQSVGFATGSSAATLPATLKSVESSGQVPKDLKNFVLSLGATLNMDGGAIYFPTAIIFLAVSEGLEDQLDVAKYFFIVLLSTFGSAGTAPVASASMVLIITAYNTAFSTTGTPASFGTIFAIDWLMTRFRVIVNITGDMTVARVVAALVDEDDL